MYAKLKQVIDSHPEWSALTDDQIKIELEKTVQVDKEYIANIRNLMGDLGVVTAHTIMAKLEMAAQSDAILARIVPVINDTKSGIDISHPQTKGMLSQLVSQSVITQEEKDLIVNLATETVSVAKKEGLNEIPSIQLINLVRSQ